MLKIGVMQSEILTFFTEAIWLLLRVSEEIRNAS